MKSLRPLQVWTLRTGLLAAGLLAFSATAQAPADIRVALVIGNSAYPAPAALQNPVNDATAMAVALRRLGFTVVEVKDGTRAQMAEAINTVRNQLRGKQGVGMLYYAGHGLQLDWKNYMVPVDARLNSAADVVQQTLDIDGVINAFKTAGNRMNIVVLDACRDNPFADKSSGKGLAQLDAPPGTFLAFATAPGNVAEDGVGQGNGLYTGFLVQELTKPAAKIEDVFKRVRLSVRRASNGRQIPWESTSLEDDFYFNDGQRYTFRMEDLQAIAAEAKRKEEELRRAAEAARERERQIAEQIEAEKRRAAEEAQRVAAAEERAKLEAASRERERLLALQREQERQRAEAAARQAEQTRRAEEERQREVERARAEAAEAARARLSAEEARDKAFEVQKADWDRIKNSRNAEDFFEFLKKHPSGPISEAAQARLDLLAKVQVVAVPAQGRETQPSLERRFTVGNTYTYEVRDWLTRVVVRRETTTVTAVKDDIVEINNGEQVYTLSGGVIRNSVGITFDPPLQTRPAGDFQVGQKWVTRAQQTRARDRLSGWVEQEYRVVAFEEVTVPAGTFKAFKVVANISTQTGLRGVLTSWVVPSVGVVKYERRARLRNNQDNSWTREMVAYRQVG